MLAWFTGNSALTFAHPWLLLLLLAVPLLAYLRGKRGPAAALTFHPQQAYGLSENKALRVRAKFCEHCFWFRLQSS